MRYRKLSGNSRVVCRYGKRSTGAIDNIGAPDSFSVCPFCHRPCKKKSGVCEMAFERQDMIVCPFRFEENNVIFLDALNYMSISGNDYSIHREVKLSNCFFDYVLRSAGQYALLEVQALDTSGSSWWELDKCTATNENQRLLSKRHKPVGPNWQMSIKTLFSEVTKKCKIAESLGTSLFLAVQDGLWDYIGSRYHYSANGRGIVWMVYSVTPNGVLAKKQIIEMSSEEFLEMTLSEEIESPKIMLEKLRKTFNEEERRSDY